MRTNKILVIAVVAIILGVVMLSGCGSSKKVATAQKESTAAEQVKQMQDEMALIRAKQELADAQAAADRAAKQREANAVIAERNATAQAERLAAATEMPCQMYDDDEWFYATGVRQFKQNSVNTAATALLRSTQLQMRQKLASVYQAVTRDYFDQMNTDEGNYANEHIESAGDLVVRARINETYETCRKNTTADANGMITMYMTVKVSKKKFVDDVVKEITKDKQMEVRFNEKQVRDSAFKVFEDSNNKEYNDFSTQSQE